MKKVVVCILVMLFSVCSYGQKLPSIAPVSPEAANIGKYGDIPVNLSTGKINYNIPLFSIKEGSFELPIYLSYNHSGLLAEETPGITGLGWTLHSGGRITRELRGRADEEDSYGYIGGNVGLDLVVPFLNGTFRSDLTNDQRKNARITFLERVNENKYDTQPDKYNINGGGLSGSFTYNEYGFEKENVVFLNQKNYEIDRDVNNNSFDIKDDKGIDYSFNKTENSVSEDFFISEKTPIYYTSSWLLSEINLPNSSSKINFEYFNDLEGYSNSFVTENQSTGCGPTKKTNVDIITTSSQKLVSKIIFPNGYITFKVNKTPSTSKSKIGYYLNEISVFNNLDKRIKKYEFVYDNLNSNLRLLQEIKLYDRANQIIPFYSFEYYGSSMPLELNAKSQDLWGYYNNTNNTSLINGNRRLDFNSTVLGALKEIKYPTGGSTKLEYEQNATNFTEIDDLFLLEASNCSLYNYNKQVILSSTSGRKTKRILFDSDQLIKVTLLTRTSGNGIASSNGGFRKIRGSGDLHCDILSKCNSNCEKSITTESELGNSTGNIHVSSFFSIKKGDELELFVDVFSSNASSFANVIIDYYGKEEANVDFFIPVGGLRIKKTSDCFRSGECIEKEYKYSPGLMLSNPNYSYTTKDDNGCQIKNISTKSKTSISSYQGISVFYNQVEIHNNKDNGKQINYYSYNRNNSGVFPFAPVENKDWRKGNLIKQKIYKQDNNDYKLVKKVENTYSNFDINFISTGNNKSHSTGLTVGQFAPYPKIVNPTQGTLTLPTESVYKKVTTFIHPEYYHLTSTTSTDYLEGKEIINTTTYLYDDTTGYLTKQTTRNSKGEGIITETKYPYQTNNTRLINENRISTPIEVETSKKAGNITTTLSTQNTVYKDFDGIYLPEKVQTLKGGQTLEDRVIFHSYDAKGNPVEVSKKDGTKIYYVWGYNQTQPIAKIEGYDSISNDQLTVINAAVLTSHIDRSEAEENTLRLRLSELRAAFPEAQVTSFTYDPLIGVTSITDPRGETIYYQYDNFNRLQFIKNAAGHILKEHQYNYKN